MAGKMISTMLFGSMLTTVSLNSFNKKSHYSEDNSWNKGNVHKEKIRKAKLKKQKKKEKRNSGYDSYKHYILLI